MWVIHENLSVNMDMCSKFALEEHTIKLYGVGQDNCKFTFDSSDEASKAYDTIRSGLHHGLKLIHIGK